VSSVLALAVLPPLWTTTPALLHCTSAYTSVKPVIAGVCVGSTGGWFSVRVVSRVNCTSVSPITPVLVTSDQPVVRVLCCRCALHRRVGFAHTGSTGAIVFLLPAL
jgi:hypothetical protein